MTQRIAGRVASDRHKHINSTGCRCGSDAPNGDH